MNAFCYIKNTCKLIDEENCNETCWKFLQLQLQYKKARIPERYFFDDINLVVDEYNDDDFESFKFLKKYSDSIFEQKNNGNGLFLWSEGKGNGKTSWAIKILKSYLRQLHRTIESFEETKGMFINVPILFDKLRHSIDSPDDDTIKMEKDIKTVDVLVLDDIGTEAPTKWVKEKLYIYLSERELANKITIFTSNVSLADLDNETLLGERIVDRIHDQAKLVIQLTGSSRRRVK